MFPYRLGVLCNFSLFNYEIRGKPDDAISMAREAVEGVNNAKDRLPDENLSNIIELVDIIEKNLNMWNSNVPGKSTEAEMGE